MTFRLILNADDAGIAPCVNEAILQGAKAGKISAASVMPNMPFAEDAVLRFQSETPQLDLGLHFCLTSGRSVSHPENLPLLVGDDGHFKHSFLGLWKKAISRNRKRFLSQIHLELTEQLKWFEKRSIPIRFLDSHQHIHLIPGIFELFQRTAHERAIFLRISDERVLSFKRFFKRFSFWLRGGLLKKLILSHLAGKKRVCGSGAKIHYCGVLDTGHFFLPAWSALLIPGHFNHSGDVLLVNIHPATSESKFLHKNELCCSVDDFEFLSSQNRSEEFQTLFSDNFEQLCQKSNVRIVGFRNI